MNRILTIAKKEFRITAANKTFIIMTILGPVLIIALAVLPGFLTQAAMQSSTESVVGIVFSDGEPAANAALLAVLNASLSAQSVTIREGSTRADLERQVADGTLNGFLVVPPDYLDASTIPYYSATGTDLILSSMIEGVIGYTIVAQRLQAQGLDPAMIQALTSRPTVTLNKLGTTEDRGSQDFNSVFYTALAFAMVIYMSIMLYGSQIGQSVLKEKTSKTVEVVLSSVTPNQLMFGKILGFAAASALQYTIWALIGIAVYTILGPALHFTIPAAVNPTNLAFLVVFFILGYVLYSAGYAALGSAAQDAQNLGQLQFPLMIFLILSIVTMSAVIMAPNSTIAVVFSLFPMTAPVTMLARIIVSPPAFWEIALSIGLMLVAIVGMTAMSAKIFRTGILMSGKKFKFSEILSWLRA